MFHTLSEKISALPETKLIWLLTFIGCLIAWRVIYIQHGWINDDSVLYFEVARLFSLGDWKAGNLLYEWPFYSGLIAALHQVSGASFQLSAQILDVAFFAITTFSFLTLIRMAGGNQLTIFCGALLLFSTSYIVGDILPMLLRDQGFWAFFLASICFFIQFYRQQTIKAAVLWQVCALLAVLFRIEAVTFLALLPLIFLVEKRFKGLNTWLTVNSLNLILLTVLLLTITFHPTLNLADFGRLNEIFNLLTNGFVTIASDFDKKASIIAEQVLGNFLDDYSVLVLLTGLFAILIVKCLLCAGWVSLALLIIKLREASALIKPDALKIFYWLIALAVLNAALILVNVFVLSGRYLASLIFILLLLSAFCLAQLMTEHKKGRNSIILSIVLSILVLSLIINLLPKKAGYNYEQQAVAWLKDTEKTSNENIFFVSPRARYYAGAPYQGRGYDYWDYTQRAIADKSIYGYDYLLINLGKGNESAEKEKLLTGKLSQYQLVNTFFGVKKNKKMLVYKKVND